MTNYHVVSGASSSKVVLSSGAVYDAKLVASEPNKDISVLKIDRLDEALTPIQSNFGFIMLEFEFHLLGSGIRMFYNLNL